MAEYTDFDVFVSYGHAAKPTVDRIVSTLESRMIRCWFAPRDVRGGYASSIMSAISKCRVFLLILDQKSSESPQVLNEIEAAYGRLDSGNISIIPFKLDEGPFSPEMLYYVKRLHWIDVSSDGLEQSVDTLARWLYGLLPDRETLLKKEAATRASNEVQHSDPSKRQANRYFEKYGDEAAEEGRWLHLQNLILKEFDRPVYDALLRDKHDLCVLDVGCSDGDVLHDRLGSRAEVSRILGVDANESMLDCARARLDSSNKYAFLACDIESGEFAGVLREYLNRQGLTGFDFVNINMVILHLRRPYVVLRTIRRFLNDGACVFIRDIDDGLNVAHPDHGGNFERLNKLCNELPTTGCRTSGRQIYSMLTRAGYEDISLERSGLSTVGMTHDQRYAMFMTCFDWLGGDLRVRSESEPDNQQYREDSEWFDETIDEIEESFQDPTFFYQEGFMIYTARSFKAS